VGSEASFPQNKPPFISTDDMESADDDGAYYFVSYRDDCMSGMQLAAKGLETFVCHYNEYRSQQNLTFTYRLRKRKCHYSG
jgi:hypothetical protein